VTAVVAYMSEAMLHRLVILDVYTPGPEVDDGLRSYHLAYVVPKENIDDSSENLGLPRTEYGYAEN
jgi:hypothetical protein